jgi:hypothetical protein
LIVSQESERDEDTGGVDRDVDRGARAAGDEALVILVEDGVGERDPGGGGERLADGRTQRPVPECGQRAEHERVAELAQHQVPRAQAGVEVGLGREPEDNPHQGEGRRGARCRAGNAVHGTHCGRVEQIM